MENCVGWMKKNKKIFILMMGKMASNFILYYVSVESQYPSDEMEVRDADDSKTLLSPSDPWPGLAWAGPSVSGWATKWEARGLRQEVVVVRNVQGDMEVN